MANARAVKEVPISAKSRAKTNVFWSTVPENEQFRNVQIPGVALDRFTCAKQSTEPQKYVQVVQKAKSDSAILGIASKQGKVGHKFAVKQGGQSDISGKKNDASGFFKGVSTSDGVGNISTMSESSNPRRASLKNLNVQDKKRVANLIKELAKTGEERELALERLQEERVSFEEQLSAVQEEQATLKQERETLTQRLEKSENLLKKYESQLKDVKTEKEEQDKLLKKKFQVQPQSTQTSPLVQPLGTDGTSNLKKGGIKARGGINAQNTQAYAGENESKENTGRMRWNKPQLPVYSNTLFDVKVSDAEHEQSSETQSIREEHQRSRVTDSSVLHELYLREYSMQLRLQEQQIEIQRQQVQLQQQLQLLQQQQQQQPGQQQQQQGQEQPGLFQQRQEEDNQQRQREIIQQHEDGSQRQHFNPKQRSQEEKERPHKKKLYPSKQENTFKEHSPKQTNFLQKRTPDRRDQQIEEVERLGSIPREHTVRSSRQRHDYDHHGHEMENSVHEHETARQQDIPHTPPGSPSPNHYHKTRSSPEYHKIKHNTDSTRYHYERHHVPKRKSPGNTHRINEATHVDINNNEYFQPRSPSQGQLKNRYDTNGDSMQERYLQEYLSDSNESYSETDSDAVHHHTSERACHRGYYHNHTRQQYDQPVLKRSHTKDTPHCDLKSTDNPDNKGGAQHQAPYANITVHQRLLHDVNRSQVRERQLPVRHHDHHIHKGEYRRLRDIHEKQSSQDDRGVPHYATHRHTREPPFEAAFYQPSKELISKHEPTGHPIHTQRQSGFSTSSLSAPKGVLTNNPPDRQEYFRPQINQDKSKDLLDDYIYNHRNAEHYDAKLDVGYGPRDKGNQQLTKRKISRKGHDRKQRAGGTVQSRYLPRTSTVGEQEDENPGYSLSKPNIPHPTKDETRTPSDHSQYPNSLIEIVEDLEINNGYEERYSKEAEEPDYFSDEEESTVLDNIFFLKR